MGKALILSLALAGALTCSISYSAESGERKELIYQPGQLTPTSSRLNVKVGDLAPDFNLQSLSGKKVSLTEFRGKKNVVISFVPAAWTPVCSSQWPGYNRMAGLLDLYDAVVLGISVDNIPSLYAWTRGIGELRLNILSDFWPHGKTADCYGILRPEGITERAIFIVDKEGIIRYIDVHDINTSPEPALLIQELAKIQAPRSAQAAPGGTVTSKETLGYKISLEGPSKAADMKYLGLVKSAEITSLSEIKAQILIVEVFDRYCPFCQGEAVNIDKVYELVREAGLSDKVKVIGLEISTSKDDIATYKERFNVLFPIFVDRDNQSYKIVGIVNVPYFLIYYKGADGEFKKYTFVKGKLDPESFFRSVNECMKSDKK